MVLSMRQGEGGFSLIEALVAVLVLSVGLIGAAATQLAALRARHESALLSQGVQLAQSLAERMRANRGQLAAGDGANPYLRQYDTSTGAPAAPPAHCFGGAACDGGALALLDIFETTQALHAGFPGGRIAVCRDALADGVPGWACGGGPGSPIVIKLGWRGRDAADAALAEPALMLVLVLAQEGA